MRHLLLSIMLLCALFACGKDAPEQPKAPAHVPSLYARDLNNEAVSALKVGNFDLALEKSNQAIENDPKFAMPYYNRALAQVFAKRFEGARDSLETCVSLNAKHGEAHLLLGLLLEREKELSEANSHYKAARACFEESKVATMQNDLYLAIAIYLGDGLVRGLEALEILVAKYPKNPAVRDAMEHVRAGERDFFLNWMLEQQWPTYPVQGSGQS